MATSTTRRPRILAIDAGGTMTDTFLIDEDGVFVIGKAQTTPEDESIGFMESARDALAYWGTDPDTAFPLLRSGIYSGTAMLNRLLERKGRNVGIIVTAGMEDYLRMERGIQTYLGYSYSDRLHVVTHKHNVPLVPRKQILGVRERINTFGVAVIPMYEHEARDAVERLIDMGVEAIVVNLLYSYRNPGHEVRIGEIAAEVMKEKGREVPIYLSSQLYPLRADFPRLNATLLEAYAAEPSREQLQQVRRRAVEAGAKFDLRIMASHGGTISIDARELARTLISGPIGGVVGARYLSQKIGVRNIACTDIGGTSFDIALVTDGDFEIDNVPDVARFLLNIPFVQIDSVGAGTGSYVRVNPTSVRVEIGPDSAGARIGVCWPEGGVETVTITDCDLILGLLNPDFFLGGDITLNPNLALEAVRKQIAEPLGLDVYDAAAGVVELFEHTLKNNLMGRIVGKGYGPENYTLLSYGGGGPLHVGGYSEGLHFEDILIPAWAAGFSAFGCACGDFEYRYDQSVDMPALPTDTEEQTTMLMAVVNGTWELLEAKVAEAFAKNHIEKDAIAFRPALRMQYYGQLNDLEFKSPSVRIESIDDLEAIKQAFETLYEKIYYSAARTPEFGYLITRAIMTGSVKVEQPELPIEALSGETPRESAHKEGRRVYRKGQWQDASILDMEQLQAGNVVEGPSVIEAPASTLVVPDGRSVRLDEHRIFHMSIDNVEDR